MELPVIFGQLEQAARERRLIPFLTEFGAFQEAEEVREYLNLQFNQIETLLLNATIKRRKSIILRTVKIIGISRITLSSGLTENQET